MARFPRRCFSSPSILLPFEDSTKFWQKERVARNNPEASRRVDYIWQETADRLKDRLADLKEAPKGCILDLGSGPGRIFDGKSLEGLDELHLYDPHPSLLHRDVGLEVGVCQGVIKRTVGSAAFYKVISDTNRQYLPYPLEYFDMALSNLSLHWVNDLAGTLQEVRRVLKGNSAFIGVMMGGETLYELRCALQLAQEEIEGGWSPHVSPMIGTSLSCRRSCMTPPIDAPRLAGALMEAGFKDVTVDTEDLVIEYPSPSHLVTDLRAMGETNCLVERKPYLKRSVWKRAQEIYFHLYGRKPQTEAGIQSGIEITVPATFSLLWFIGWKNQ